MAKGKNVLVTSGGICRGCGTRRGVGHCLPSSMGITVKNVNHPSNNGEWADVLSGIMSMKYMKNRDPEHRY